MRLRRTGRIARAAAVTVTLAAMGAGSGADASLREALAAANGDRWESAARLAAAQGGTAPAIIEWRRLRDRDGGAGFPDYRAFLAEYGDWPGLPLLRRRGEATLSARTPRSHVLAYFANTDPQTPAGAYWLAQAQAAEGREAAARDTLVRAWRTMAFDAQDHALYLGRYRELLAPHHEARMDDVLWRGARAEAARMRPLVGAGWQALTDARLGLRADTPGVDGLIARVPSSLQDDPGLAFERMAWRMRRDRYLSAADLMQAQSGSAERLGRPEVWADRRRRLARQLMRDGQTREAYLIASQHHLTDWPFEDLEWLSGYIALRYLDAPGAAVDHFRRGRATAGTPVWLGRMGYWEGRAHSALNDTAAAAEAYGFAAGYQTSFYGQLAAEAAGLAPDPRLTGSERFPDGANAAFRQSSIYQAGVSLHGAGDLRTAGRFFGHLAESLPRAQVGSMAARLEVLEAPHVQVAIAKSAARRGLQLHKAYFPVIGIDTRGAPDVPRELALSIARQESEFNPAAISNAGARGMMQLMPGTARLMAPVIGEDYSLNRLTRDPLYNIRLGTAYLQRLHDRFGANLPLIAAGYNAGPGRPLAWMERYGDPRGGQVDPIDWIEHIPFRETRTYVMFVMQGVAPYRARLTGETAPLGLTAALQAR